MSKLKKIKLTEGTILEQFKHYVKDHRKVSDIISFLSVKNAQLIKMDPNHIPDSLKKELFEFYDYFFDNYDEVTEIARAENWEEEPYIFRLTDWLYEEDIRKEQDEMLESMSKGERREADILCDTLFQIRKERKMRFVVGDQIIGYDLPRTLYREELEGVKRDLLVVCAGMILTRGFVVVNLIEKNHTDIFGISVNGLGIWIPISKEDMKEMATTTRTGIQLEPEDHVVFTEIQREQI